MDSISILCLLGEPAESHHVLFSNLLVSVCFFLGNDAGC